MIDIWKLSIEELEAIAKTEDWIMALLADPSLERKRRLAIDCHEIEYIQTHYTDEGRLHSWSTSDCNARQLCNKHPWPDAKYIRYEPTSSWAVEDKAYSMVRVDGEYWIDIWVAASKCIDELHKKYGKDDHTFIEGVVGCFDGVLYMSTGS